MKYSQPSNTGRSIIHKFSKGEHYIGGKKWNNVEMGFREVPTNSENRNFMFTIKYSNPSDNEYKLNQFTMREDEIKVFLDIVNKTVNNPPKFKDTYKVGDRFILPDITVLDIGLSYKKEIKYTNVEATIMDSFNLDGGNRYRLNFDNNSIIICEDSLKKLKRSL